MSDQKNWDAALIKTWRLAGSIGDVYALFSAIAGKRTDACDPPLKRMPPKHIPWGVGVRVFVAEHLSKISNRLWDQPPVMEWFARDYPEVRQMPQIFIQGQRVGGLAGLQAALKGLGL